MLNMLALLSFTTTSNPAPKKKKVSAQITLHSGMKLTEKKSQRNGVVGGAEWRTLACMPWGALWGWEQKRLFAPCLAPSGWRGGTELNLPRLLCKYNLKCLQSSTSVEKTTFCSITIIIVEDRAKNTIWLSESCHLNLKQLHTGLKGFHLKKKKKRGSSSFALLAVY